MSVTVSEVLQLIESVSGQGGGTMSESFEIPTCRIQ